MNVEKYVRISPWDITLQFFNVIFCLPYRDYVEQKMQRVNELKHTIIFYVIRLILADVIVQPHLIFSDLIENSKQVSLRPFDFLSL
jgi:hypothetical protein